MTAAITRLPVGAPASIDAIMRGPHLTELVTDDTVPAIVVEPLRFIAPMQIAGRDVFPTSRFAR